MIRRDGLNEGEAREGFWPQTLPVAKRPEFFGSTYRELEDEALVVERTLHVRSRGALRDAVITELRDQARDRHAAADERPIALTRFNLQITNVEQTRRDRVMGWGTATVRASAMPVEYEGCNAIGFARDPVGEMALELNRRGNEDAAVMLLRDFTPIRGDEPPAPRQLGR